MVHLKNEETHRELRRELDEVRVENDKLRERNQVIEQRLYRLGTLKQNELIKPTPNIHELLGNIDNLTAKNLSSFGIKNRIGSTDSSIAPFRVTNPLISVTSISNDIKAKQMISSVSSSMGYHSGPLCNIQLKADNLHPSYQSPIQRHHQLVSEGMCHVKDKLECSKSKSKVSMYSVTVSRPRNTPSCEDESKENGSSYNGTSEHRKCTYQLHFSGQRLMATPDKSDMLDIRNFSPINENFELVANNSCFLSPESNL
jgi:hypothetical protein